MRRLSSAFLVGALATTLVGCDLLSPRAALVFSPGQLGGAIVGSPYLATISVSQNATPIGDMWVDDGSLPPGLELEFLDGTDTGQISGTPTTAGSYQFSVRVWCYGTNVSGQTGEQAYTIAVQ